PMLERAGEERARRRERLELPAGVAEADEQGPRVKAGERVDQNLDALVLDQLSEVDDGRLLEGEEALKAVGVPLVGQPFLEVARVRRIGARFLEQRGQRFLALFRPELGDIDAGRHDLDSVDMACDL